MEPASPREKDGDVVWVPNSGVAALIGFAAQTKLIRFESAGASAIHTPPLLVYFQVTRRGLTRCGDYIAIYWTVLYVSRHADLLAPLASRKEKLCKFFPAHALSA